MQVIQIIYNIVLILWYLGFIGLIYYFYKTAHKPYQAKFQDKYYFDIPEYLNPGELSILMYKKIKPDVITATILYLIRKGVIEKKGRGKKYTLIYKPSPSLRLAKSQEYILDILFQKISEGKKQITIDQINEFANSHYNCSNFLTDYQIWHKLIIQESKQKQFYEPKQNYSIIQKYRNIAIVLFLINFLLPHKIILGYFIPIPAYLMCIYFYKIYKRTEIYNEEYHKWQAFNNYLKNINNFNDSKKKLDIYYIYSSVLGSIQDLENNIEGKTGFNTSLNKAINKCVINAELKGNRRLWKNELRDRKETISRKNSQKK